MQVPMGPMPTLSALGMMPPLSSVARPPLLACPPGPPPSIASLLTPSLLPTPSEDDLYSDVFNSSPPKRGKIHPHLVPPTNNTLDKARIFPTIIIIDVLHVQKCGASPRSLEQSPRCGLRVEGTALSGTVEVADRFYSYSGRLFGNIFETC